VGLVIVASLVLAIGTVVVVRRRQRPPPESESRGHPIWYSRVQLDEDPIVAAIGLAPEDEHRRTTIGVSRPRAADEGEGGL
jgi:hypothetical protein